MLVFPSDASSEYLSTVDLTDSEDAGRAGSIFGQDPSGPQVALMGGSYAGLSPMIIMNNFVLNQVNTALYVLPRACFITLLSLFGSALLICVFLFKPYA